MCVCASGDDRNLTKGKAPRGRRQTSFFIGPEAFSWPPGTGARLWVNAVARLGREELHEGEAPLAAPARAHALRDVGRDDLGLRRARREEAERRGRPHRRQGGRPSSTAAELRLGACGGSRGRCCCLPSTSLPACCSSSGRASTATRAAPPPTKAAASAWAATVPAKLRAWSSSLEVAACDRWYRHDDVEAVPPPPRPSRGAPPSRPPATAPFGTRSSMRFVSSMRRAHPRTLSTAEVSALYSSNGPGAAAGAVREAIEWADLIFSEVSDEAAPRPHTWWARSERGGRQSLHYQALAVGPRAAPHRRSWLAGEGIRGGGRPRPPVLPRRGRRPYGGRPGPAKGGLDYNASYTSPPSLRSDGAWRSCTNSRRSAGRAASARARHSLARHLTIKQRTPRRRKRRPRPRPRRRMRALPSRAGFLGAEQFKEGGG